jgi:ankyrin repeat protein
LYDASKKGDLEKVDLILSNDSSLLNKVLNKDGFTALSTSSCYNRPSVVKFLLIQESIDVNKQFKVMVLSYDLLSSFYAVSF